MSKSQKSNTKQIKRESNERNNKKNERQNQLKNLCNHPRLTNSNHEWKDCIYNRHSKNYCGNNGKKNKSNKEEIDHLRSQRSACTTRAHQRNTVSPLSSEV